MVIENMNFICCLLFLVVGKFMIDVRSQNGFNLVIEFELQEPKVFETQETIYLSQTRRNSLISPSIRYLHNAEEMIIDTLNGVFFSLLSLKCGILVCATQLCPNWEWQKLQKRRISWWITVKRVVISPRAIKIRCANYDFFLSSPYLSSEFARKLLLHMLRCVACAKFLILKKRAAQW